MPSAARYNGHMSERIEKATLGGGCFWCIEAVYQELKGVKSAISGYTGGHVDNPTYRQVCEGTTGHVEVVQVSFDPEVVSYKDVLGVFFAVHDPTTKDRQGGDVGPQYRSAIFTEDEGQAATARELIAEIKDVYNAPIVTVIQPLGTFYAAEDYHQRYFEQNPTQSYCTAVVAPKVAKFRKAFMDRLAR
ncbi:MAG: peptide methionine sulfoxide reductase [Cyanobacteria bacterium RYN_339]|nr:peptide methionine sulfoxide reductase [Cyanobacteria bacterium RYN_339]